MTSIKKISFAIVLSAFAFAQYASAATTLYSQSVSAGTSVNSQEAIGGSDRDVFTFATFTATQTGTVDNISWQGTANPATGFTGFSDGFTIDVLDGSIALPGSVAYAPVSSTFLASTGLANPVLATNGMYNYNASVKPFYVQAGKVYHISIRANGIAPWGWATGPGTGTIAYVAGVFRFLPSPGIPVYALNNVNNTVVAPPLVNPTAVTIVPVPAPVATTVVGATGDVQGMVTGIGNGYFTTDTVIGGIHGATLTYDGDTVTTYHGGLVTYAVGEMVNYSYTVDTNGVMLAKTVDVYPTEVVNGVGRVAGYTTTNGVLNGNGLGLTSGEVLTGSAVPYVNFTSVYSYNLIMTYTGFRNPTTGFVYATSAQTSTLPITVKPVLPAASVGQMFNQNPLDFSLFGAPANLGAITASGLPAGMVVSGTSITGIPQVAGTYTVTINVFGDLMMLGGAKLGSGTTTIVVNPADPNVPAVVATPVTFVSTLANAQATVFYPATNLIATGMTPLTVTATGVPVGMTVSSAGVLSGYAAVGTYTIALSATSAEGVTGTGSVTLTVGPAPVIPLAATLVNGKVGVAYPATNLASASYLPLFMVSSVTGVPAGMTVSLTGVLFGTPSTAGTYQIGFYAIGSGLRSLGNATATLVVDPATVVVVPPADTIAPVITMNGTNVNLTVGTLYVDAGATCTDNVDATCTVVTTSTVNTAIAGTYTVTYSAKDVAGNIATPVVRTVTVTPVSTDTVAPVITMNGTDVTLIAGNAYVDAGAICMDNVDPTCNVVTTSTVNTAVVGVYTVTYTATDFAGNIATPVVRTVTVNPASVVTISGAGTVSSIGRDFLVINGGLNASDHVFYTLTPAGTTFLGGVITFATGEYVTFTGTVDGLGAIHATSMTVYPAVTYVNVLANAQATVAYPVTNLMVSGTAPFAVMATGVPAGMTVDASGILSGTPTTAGVYSMTLAATDSIGNIGRRTLNITVDAAPDTVAPVITMTGTNAVLTVGDVYVDAGATCTDNVDATCTVVTTGVVDTTIAGTYTVTYGATDVAGNIATPVVRTVTVNPAPVVVTTSGAGVVTSIGRNFLVINGGLNAADHVFYTPTAAGTTFFGGVTTFATGQYVTFTGTVDSIGSVSATSMSVYPAVTFVTTLANAQATVAYTATNLMVSGTAPFTVTATGVPAGMTVDALGVLTGTPTTAGTYTINLSAIDSVGNTGAGVVNVIVTQAPDTVAPVITMNGTNVTLIAGTSYVDAGATCKDNVDVTCTVVTTSTVNSAVVGTYTVTYTAKDIAGNIATPVVRTVTVNPVPDTVAPVITMLGTNVTFVAGTAYVDAGATCKDNVDATCTVTTVSTVNTAVAGTYTVTYSAKDVAGNIATQVVRTVTVTPVLVAVTFVATLTNAQATVAYTAKSLLATGVAPFVVTATGVPAGMTVSSVGVLSGTPSTAGTYTINLSATSAQGVTATASQTLVVSAAPVTTGGVVSTGKAVEATGKIITAITSTTITAGGVLIRLTPTTTVQLNNKKPLVVGNKIEYKGVLNTDASVTATSVKIQ
jgi:hypothetical protein